MSFPRPGVIVLGCLIALGFGTPAWSQDNSNSYSKRLLPAVKIKTPPVIDGDVSEVVWQEVTKAETFIDRQNGNVVADQTIAYLLYDSQYIYVGFHCKDSQPDKINARETVRDSKYANRENDRDTEDNVEVVFDTFRTYRWEDQTRFSLNAIGTRSARISGGRGSKLEWAGDWEGAVKRTADGWTAEMRIPWPILNFPSSKQPITIGINFVRFQDRTKISSFWSNTGSQNFMELEGQWTGVEVPHEAFRPKLSLLPYLLPSIEGSKPHFRFGVDARYPVTPELTAVATLNPDFATVEGAVESINFSRSERFVPERRPFFLEGQDYFRAGAPFLFGPYFYTQRIEHLDVGAKVYGKVGRKGTIGLLYTQDFTNRNDMVMRYRHELAPNKNVGFFFTQRSARDDNNTMGALMQDARWGKFGVSGEWAFSSGRDAGADAKSVNLTYEDKNNFSSFVLMGVSPHFRDANGLIFFTDYLGISAFHVWSAEWRKGPWRSFNGEFWLPWQWHYNGLPWMRGGNIGLNFDTRSDWRFGLDWNYIRFDNTLDSTIGIGVTSGASNRFRQWGFKITAGQQGSKPSFQGEGEFSLRLFRKFDLAFSGTVLNLEGNNQQHILTMSYELSPVRSFGGRLVAENGDVNWYVFYRHSGASGTETYFMFGDPNAKRFTMQAALKLVFAL